MGLIRIKLLQLLGLCKIPERRILALSASQALLKSRRDVEAGRLFKFSVKLKRFFKGLTKSAELVDRIKGSGFKSSSSSGMLSRFLPTASKELR